MAETINIPMLGMTMKEAKIVEWIAKEGDWVEKGSVVLAIETDKISFEVEALASGYLHILEENGEVAEVGAVIGYLAESKEELKMLQKKRPLKTEKKETPPEDVSEIPSANPPTKKGRMPAASPIAKRIAKELGVDLVMVKGTGPSGRITKDDVTKYHQAGPTSSPLLEKKPELIKTIPFTGMRKSIAENMYSSLQNSAQLTVSIEADVTEMVMFLDVARKEFETEPSVKITFTSIIVLAVSRVLKRLPNLNSCLAGDEIRLHDDVNMGIAVSIPDGLIVPVIHKSNKKGLLDISKEVNHLIQKARGGTLSVEDVTGGTFTITNLGMYDIDVQTPILRFPETGILGVGRINEKPVVHDGEICVRSMIWLSLTWNHQVVDGAEASHFLQTVARHLKHPALISS